MRTTINLLVFSFFLIMLASTAGLLPAHAQTQPVVTTPGVVNSSSADCGTTAGAIANPLKFCTLEQLFGAILKAIVQLGTIALTFAFVFLGFQYVNARGNAAKITALHKSFLYTIVGGLILMGAYGIGKVIESTVNSITN